MRGKATLNWPEFSFNIRDLNHRFHTAAVLRSLNGYETLQVKSLVELSNGLKRSGSLVKESELTHFKEKSLLRSPGSFAVGNIQVQKHLFELFANIR